MARDFDPNIPQDWTGWWLLDAGYGKTIFSAQEIIDMTNQERNDLRDVFVTYYEYLWDEDMARVRELVQNRNQVKFLVNDLVDLWYQDYLDQVANGVPATEIVQEFDNKSYEVPV